MFSNLSMSIFVRWPTFDTLSANAFNLGKKFLVTSIFSFSNNVFYPIVDIFSSITRRQISDWSKMKQSAEDNLKFVENIRKFSKRVENTVGKGEIARYKQFLLLPQCFQKACFPGASKVSLCGNGFNSLSVQTLSVRTSVRVCCFRKQFTYFLQLYHRIPTFKDAEKEALLKTFKPFQNKPCFLHVCSTSLLKILWKKEKLLVTSNFSFSHSVFSPFEDLSSIFIKIEIIVCKLFQFGRV